MDDRMIEAPPMAPPPAPRTQPPKKDERPTPWRVEGEREPTGGDGGGGRRRMSGPPFGRRWIYLILALLAFNVLFAQLFTPRTDRVSVPYTFFLDQVDAGNVSKVDGRGEHDQGRVQEGGAARARTSRPTRTSRPSARPSPSDDDLFAQLQANDVTVDAENPDEGPGMLATILLYFGPDAAARRPLHLDRPAGGRRRRRRRPRPASADRAPSATSRPTSA